MAGEVYQIMHERPADCFRDRHQLAKVVLRINEPWIGPQPRECLVCDLHHIAIPLTHYQPIGATGVLTDVEE